MYIKITLHFLVHLCYCLFPHFYQLQELLPILHSHLHLLLPRFHNHLHLLGLHLIPNLHFLALHFLLLDPSHLHPIQFHFLPYRICLIFQPMARFISHFWNSLSSVIVNVAHLWSYLLPLILMESLFLMHQPSFVPFQKYLS